MKPTGQGKLHFPYAALRQLPLCVLAGSGHPVSRLPASGKSKKKHRPQRKGGEKPIRNVNTGYMVRAPTRGRTTPLQLNTATPQHLRSVGTAAKTGGFFHTQKPFSKPQEAAESEGYMAFFNSAVSVLQTLVIALGAGLGVWGVINLLEGYGNDNPGANAHVR